MQNSRLAGPVDFVSIEDIVTAEGPRSPAAGSAQTQFRWATLVLSADRLLTDAEIAFFDLMAARGEATTEVPYTSGFARGMAKPFFVATRELATLSTTVPCLKDDSDVVCNPVDLDDFAAFAGCMNGPGVATPPPDCTQKQFDLADIDRDEDVDLQDFGAMQRVFTGSH